MTCTVYHKELQTKLQLQYSKDTLAEHPTQPSPYNIPHLLYNLHSLWPCIGGVFDAQLSIKFILHVVYHSFVVEAQNGFIYSVGEGLNYIFNTRSPFGIIFQTLLDDV